MWKRPVRVAWVAAILLGGAGGGCVNTSGNRDVACRPVGPASATRAAAAASPFHGSVFTIVMENQSASTIFGQNGPAYINWLAAQGAIAAGYGDDFVHPSEPNYLWMTAGENFGVLDDNGPQSNHVACASHVADQLEAAGLSWRAYQESMGAPCNLDGAYPYEPKHNPFVYYDDVDGWNGQSFAPSARCVAHDVDYTQLDADLASGDVPRYLFITPNMQDDMHDGSIAQGDAWLSRQVPKILASTAWQDGGVLFILWDEGASESDNPPLFVVSPLAKKGYVSHVPYDTSAYLKTVQAILGLDPLPCDPAPATVATMADLFTVPLPGAATSAAASFSGPLPR